MNDFNLIGIFNYVLTNAFNALVMFYLFGLFFWAFNKLTPNVDFQEELKKGNMAVAILIVGMAIAFAIVLKQ